MNTNIRATALRLVSLIAIVAMLPTGTGMAQSAPEPPGPATPFDSAGMQASLTLPSFGMQTPLLGDTFQTGADRLAAMQYSDGGWGWPLVAPPTYFNTLQPISAGFIQAYSHTGDPDHLAGIELARDKFMAKTNNFSPPDGILAAQLDALLPLPACGATTCVARVNSLFYGQLAAGTYNRNGLGTLYTTETYINLIQTARSGSNLAAWDLGLGLAGAVAAGVDTTNKNTWIQGVKDELNEANVAQDYEVLGLAGALYGLAKAGATFDPTSGAFTLASDLNGLGAILASYQLAGGGFTYDANLMADGNETAQETAYAILALNALSRSTFLDAILTAGDYLDSAQLGTGGWENYTSDGEDNELTGEALWALDVAYPLSTLWVCEVADGDCGHPEAYFHSIQAAIDAATAGADIFVFPGSYDETASNRTILEGTSAESGPYQFGLFFPIGKPGLSVIGIHADESLITIAGDVDAPYVTTHATNNFGPSNFWIEGADVTIRGITQGPNASGENKSVEVVADGLTLKYFKSDLPDGGGAVYINDWLYDQVTDTSTVNSWTIDHNNFNDGTQIAISSGAGVSGPVSGRIITNNAFNYDPLIAANWPGVSFNGSDTTVGWFVDPVGGSIITGNTFSGSTQYIRSRGTVEEADFDWNSYWTSNTFDRRVIDVASTTPPLLPRAFSYSSGGATFPNTRHISALIQHEVDHALAGDTVLVGAGTYVEQVSVSTAITVQGLNAATSIVQSPNALTACWGTKKPIICVQNTTATIRDLTVDGAGKGNANNQFVGIAYHNAAGTIDGNTVVHVRNTPLDGMQAGVGIYAYNEDATARTLTVTDNTVSDYQKNAMALNGVNLTANVSGNVTTGAGPTATIAQNGIQLGYEAGGTVLSNTITGNVWTGTYGGTNDPLTDLNSDAAAGILLYNTNAAVEVGDNTLTANQFGISAVSALSLNAHDNTITGLAHTGNAFPVGIGIWSGDAWTAETATSATLAFNTLTTNDYGIAIFDYGDPTPGMSITASGNVVTGNDKGVVLRSNATALTGTDFYCNQINGNTTMGVDVYGTGTFSPNLFEHNWWGNASGPYNATTNASGTGDDVDDGIDFTPWLGTSSCPNNIEVRVGGILQGKYTLPPTTSEVEVYPDLMNGPVEVLSTGGTPILASQRSLQGPYNMFNEVVGLPGNQLGNHYWFTWYDNVNMHSWMLVGNPSTSSDAHVTIKIAGVVKGTYTISPNDTIQDEWASLMNGPVEVTSDIAVFTSQRLIKPPYSSFNEIMGLPDGQMTDHYWFPWYDSINMMTWVLVGNPSTIDTAHVTIKVAGVTKGTYTIGPSGRVTPTFDNLMDGPVEVISDIPVFTSERIRKGAYLSISEVWGYPHNQLTNHYWFPWYDFVDMVTWVLIGNPSSTQTANATVKIGGVTVGTYTIPPFGRVTPTYAGTQTGPVEVTSDINVFTSERMRYDPYGSVHEIMGVAHDKLTSQYWFPWYDNASMSSSIAIGVP